MRNMKLNMLTFGFQYLEYTHVYRSMIDALFNSQKNLNFYTCCCNNSRDCDFIYRFALFDNNYNNLFIIL